MVLLRNMNEIPAMTPLEMWNVSREIAAAAYRVVNEDASYDSIAQNHSAWPFKLESEVITVVENADGDSRAEKIDSLQRIVHHRLKETVDTAVEGTSCDNRSVIAEWNAARSAATTLLNWSATTLKEGDSPVDTDTQVSYEDVREQHGDVVPETVEEATKIIMNVSGETYNDRHMALTRHLNEHQSPVDVSENTVEEVVEETVDESSDAVDESTHRQIADDFARVFLDRDGTEYKEIVAKYDDVELPARDVVLLEVVNSEGSTRTDRVESITEWIGTWYDDPQAVRDLSQNRPRRMGMST